MPTPHEIEAALAKVRDQASFIQDLLIDTLGWPLAEKAQCVSDVSYDWTADELRAAGLDKHVVESKVCQIQPPARSATPWGVFIVEFKSPDAITTGRGMTGPLRKILRGLVPKARGRPSHLPAWDRENLLFLCTHEYRHFRFAYFKEPPEGTRTPPLAAFGWGADIPARTVCEFNLPPLEWPEPAVSRDEWKARWRSAFDVEKVTREFYKAYRQVFEAAEKRIADQGDLRVPEDLRMFTQTLFNRLMFLRFIERKAWLIYKGHKDYLRALYEAGGVGNKSLYQSRIRPLFFKGLAVQGYDEPDIIGKVPFLNGGLFEEGPLDTKVKDIPDAVLAPIISRDGLFYRFHFTIEESTPLDIEVAVDPEMLGKVFEELVTGRHETGSYYTPRPVVSFMCREALKGHLAERTKAKPDAIAALVDEHEVKGVTVSDARQVLEALDDLKAADPACGSGAYLLGMLHELAAIYRLLYSERLAKDSRSLFELKLRIITRNLYGVDIDPFATSIAMLRLWLSLIVEFDGPTPPPLPNLDFKVETGDSILGPSPRFYQHDTLGLQTSAIELVELKEEYLKAHGSRKDELKMQILKKETDLRFAICEHLRPGVIDWRIQFAEVFLREKKKGFDIVLANPPYVRQELIRGIKHDLKKVYGSLYCGTADLYTYFYIRSIQILRDGGMLAFISSNKWFRADYGRKLREHIAHTCDVLGITDFRDLPVFQTAVAYAMIFVAKKGNAGDSTVLAEPPSLERPYPDVTAVVEKYGRSLPAGALKSPLWTFGVGGRALVVPRIARIGDSLEDFVKSRVYRGITTGYNTAFVIDAGTRAMLIKEDKRSQEIIKPYLAGRDIDRYCIDYSGKWLIFTRRGVDISRYPAIEEYLSQWKATLTPRKGSAKVGRKPGNYRWYEIQDEIAYHKTFEMPKIVSTKVSIRPTFAFDSAMHYTGNTTYFIPVQEDSLYILGLLNSAVFYAYAKEVFVEKQNGWYEVQPKGLEAFRIPAASPEQKQTIERLVEQCIKAGGKNCEALEAEIDELAVRLYDLKAKDLRAVRQLEAEVVRRQPEKIAKSKEFKAYMKEQFGE